MSVKPIVIFPNEVLTTECELVTEFDASLLELTEQMFASMYEFHGVGLAANQIGVTKRVAVIDLGRGDDPLVLVNPVITHSHGTNRAREGCLSVPGEWEIRDRYVSVDCDFQDCEGKHHSIHATWLLAQAIQHECDHLAGKLCLSRRTLEMFVARQAKFEANASEAITK